MALVSRPPDEPTEVHAPYKHMATPQNARAEPAETLTTIAPSLAREMRVTGNVNATTNATIRGDR
jgi:hypothetical protein